VDEINGRVGGLLFEAKNGGYELGFDYGQPYKRQKYSLGVVCIRSLDIPGERRSEKRFWKTVAIFPGPNEPKWLWPYFQGILTEFLVGWKHGESNLSLLVLCIYWCLQFIITSRPCLSNPN
jgi:hypothetical protein